MPADLQDDYINSTSKRPSVTRVARKNVPVDHLFVDVGMRLKEELNVVERFCGTGQRRKRSG
jgi:hypothetical protein